MFGSNKKGKKKPSSLWWTGLVSGGWFVGGERRRLQPKEVRGRGEKVRH